MKKNYEFLNQINFPSDLKKVPISKLQKVADELREELIDAVSIRFAVDYLGVTFGHLRLVFDHLRLLIIFDWLLFIFHCFDYKRVLEGGCT